ncbi:lectin-like protein [Heliorestis acidaminivorans]
MRKSKKMLAFLLTLLFTFSLILPSAALARQCSVMDMNFFGWATGKVVVDPHRGKTYGLFDVNKNWYEANAFAQSLGGQLVTITSKQEQDLINHLLTYGKRQYYWMGASDEEVEGQWGWVTGEPFRYTNWAPGEPNNYGGENYMALLRTNGLWNDLFGRRNELQISPVTFGLLVEWDFSYNPCLNTPTIYDSSTGNYYALYDQGMVWSDAKRFAENHGGHLATITSHREQNILKFLLATGKRSFYWLGGTDEVVEGQWQWITGEPWTYSNWGRNFPNNWGGEDYLKVINFGDEIGKWVDSYGAWIGNPESHGLIVEWK